MKYRVGLPLWKFFAKCGAILVFRVGIRFDPEAKVYYVAWSDLPGLNTDAATLEELKQNIRDCAELLLEDYVPQERMKASMRVPIYG